MSVVAGVFVFGMKEVFMSKDQREIARKLDTRINLGISPHYEPIWL